MIEDIVDYWRGLIESFNLENKCDFCWNFYAPLQEVRLNVIRPDEDNKCCVNVFLIRNEGQDFGTNVSYNRGFISNISNFENYRIFFLISSKEGLNNYNEIDGHLTEESRHETIFKPLRNCVTHNILTNLCSDYEVSNWTGRYIYDYQDENYYGIEFKITHRKNE